ncbi:MULTISPECIES: DUF1418 family protein [Pantoea]|uniref:DUF1418 family protein n=1 Tax=Pantoea TaxID=53335 RepID=UPI00061516E1|nr:MULTISPECIES: DUF1418 family protein [Pantoea]KAA5971237.1 DUF1418 family protein [Pantoea sp. M_6]KAA5980596.1 DUF1418 family protein [Pantoea sp. M_8]KAA5994279.1 DUF1418 family protein [Pantoea sp. M_10]KAA5997731.1 DUF1418 family protein [Pantoea sp. M_5]KAF6667527.1 DUF1418 family protein [Pantoea sp. EKM101V]
MQSVARLPRFVVVMEAAGGLLILGALLLINHWLPVPGLAEPKTLATLLFIAGVVLMLPAAWLLMWRTAKAIAPQLFNQTDKRK